MKNSFKYFKSNFYRHLGLYLLGIVLVPATVLTVSYYKTRIQEIEKFSVFFTTDNLESQAIHDELQLVLGGYNLLQDYQYVHSIVNENETTYLSNLEQYGYSLSDFMFIPERYATKDYLSRYAAAYKDYYLDGISFGDTEPVTYAIRVYNSTLQSGYLTEYMNYELDDEDYFLCISRNSFHYNNYLKDDYSVLKSFIDWMFTK